MCPFLIPMRTPKWLPAIALAACVLGSGCTTDRGDYGRFDRLPQDPAPVVTRTVDRVHQGAGLTEPFGSDLAQRTLIQDILQLGPWPAVSETDRVFLDSAWADFIAFEGTQIAMGGVDSALRLTGALDAADRQLKDAFGRWRAHFPEAPMPAIDFAYTGYNYSVYPTDSLLLVGCEFFIGADHPAVLGLPPAIYPRYMQQRMVPEHLVGDALRGWLLVHFQNEHYDRNGRLAEELLYWGKTLYVARCLAPDIQPHDLLDWTEAEWTWAESHERQIWSELRREESLYTRRRMDIQRWVADAPFTKAGDVPQDSPDRLGWYMGMRWVEDFMARNPEIDLPALVERQDVLPFLQAYRPGS